MATPTKSQRTQSKSRKSKFTAPSDLSKSGKALFLLLAEHLESIGFLESADLHLLHQYCRLNDALDQATEMMAKEGIMITSPHGTKPHPAVPSSTQLTGSLAKIGAQLGIGAGARKRMKAEIAKLESETPNPWKAQA